jgi:hypothetical protein
MGGFNVGRWLAGGFVAAIVVWVIEGVSAIFYMDEMETALAAMNLSMDMSAGAWMMTILVSLLVGMTAVFFYAAARPRFGPGPKTAVLVAVVYFMGGTLISILGYGMIGMYPAGMLAKWGLIGLAELIVATVVGAWVYKEEGA